MCIKDKLKEALGEQGFSQYLIAIRYLDTVKTIGAAGEGVDLTQID